MKHGLLLTGQRPYVNFISLIIYNIVVTVLMYGCTTLMKNLDENYTWMMCAVLNKSRKQQPRKQQLYGHLPPISQNMLGTVREVKEWCSTMDS